MAASASPSAPDALPAPLEGLLLDATSHEAPIGLQNLQRAQQCVANLVRTEVLPALSQGVAQDGVAASDSATGSATRARLVNGLKMLCSVWQRGETLRPLLVARHLPVELAALLELLHGPSSEEACSDESAWCAQRLDELLVEEPPLALLEALVSLLRRPDAPSWLRTSCSSC
jgi:hypothetical protein